jgi:hypothetical protein
MRVKTLVAGAGMAMGLIAPSLASAQTCNAFQPVVPDGRLSQVYTSSTAADHISYFFRGKPGRSYSVEAANVARDYIAGDLSMNLNTFDCPTTNVAGARDTASIEPTVEIPGDQERISITAASDAYYQFRVGSTGGTVSIQVNVSDTTLFSPAWSTISSFDTFYSLQNTSNATCTGLLTLYNTAGVVTDTQALTIVSGATGSTNTSAMATPRGMAGTAKFTHDCPPGALLGEAAIANFSISPTPYFQFVHFETTRESSH